MFANYFGGFMKKIIVLFFALTFLGGNAFAISDTAEFKKVFMMGFKLDFLEVYLTHWLLMVILELKLINMQLL